MNLYISNEKINSKGLAGVYRNFRKFLNRFSKEKFLNYQNHKLQSACARFIIVQNNSAKIKQGHARSTTTKKFKRLVHSYYNVVLQQIILTIIRESVF